MHFVSGNVMRPSTTKAKYLACISAVGGTDPKAGRANPKKATWPSGKTGTKICLYSRRGFWPKAFRSFVRQPQAGQMTTSRTSSCSNMGNEFRYPVHATTLSHANSDPSLNTAFPFANLNASRCNSAPLHTMAVTKPSFLQPNLEKADVPCSKLSSPILCKIFRSSEGFVLECFATNFFAN